MVLGAGAGDSAVPWRHGPRGNGSVWTVAAAAADAGRRLASGIAVDVLGRSACALHRRWNPAVACLRWHGRWSLETNTVAADPLRAWVKLPGLPAVNSILVVAGRNVIVIATADGVRWSAIPPPGGAYTWKTSGPVDQLAWVSLAAGLNQSVVAYRPPSATPKASASVAVGTWSGSTLSWQDRTPAGPPGSDLAQIAAAMSNGALASSAADPGRVYLALAKTPGDDGLVSWLAVLRSDTGGVSWTKPYVQDSSVFAPLGLQADRNLAVAAHPVNKDIVLLGSRRTGLVGSTNGGVDWDYGRWNERLGDFHADVLCITFDPTDPSGNRVWSGSDGGIFVSGDQGVSWDSSRNTRLPTLMFSGDATPGTESLGVNPSAAHPHVMVGALQDNGIAVANGLGVAWGQMYGGDGQRAVWIGPDVLFVSVNDDEKGDPGTRGLRWRVWGGGGFGGEHFTRPAPGDYTPTLNFIPLLEVIPSPSIWRDGGLLVALAADDRSANGIFGLIDRRPGTIDEDDDRFKWVRITPFADQGHGIGSFSGRHILVSSSDWIGADDNQLYLLDSANVPIVRRLPKAVSGVIRLPQFLNETMAVALCDSGILYSPDLRLLAAHDALSRSRRDPTVAHGRSHAGSGTSLRRVGQRRVDDAQSRRLVATLSGLAEVSTGDAPQLGAISVRTLRVCRYVELVGVEGGAGVTRPGRAVH